MMGTIVYDSLHSALMSLGEIKTFYPEGLALKLASVLDDIDAVKLTVRLRPSSQHPSLRDVSGTPGQKLFYMC